MKLLIILGAMFMAVYASPAANVTSTGYIRSEIGEILANKNCRKVGTKSICIDITKKTWKDAKVFCTSQGMQLAKLDNAVQFTALNGLDDPQLVNGNDYWTSGRDSFVLAQFHWDDSNTQPDASLGVHFADLYTGDYNTCLVYRRSARGNSKLTIASCSSTCYTLCETIP